MPFKCQVLHCEDTNSPRHRFPNPIKNWNLYQIWIKATGNTKLLEIEPEKVYKNMRICHRHFRNEDKSTNMYLKSNTCPSLYLPESEFTIILSDFQNAVKQTNDNLLHQSSTSASTTVENIFTSPQSNCSNLLILMYFEF
ncbi:hypothetical protein ABEB36_014990 [Hypothenemus hampei]|uniref:THAP-type domain-containing protein n=1 Tax=Hypothenemus hampei TaxID=57062 RepID=A0ABD1E1R5_HYPHA